MTKLISSEEVIKCNSHILMAKSMHKRTFIESSLLVDGVRLGDDRDDVDLAVELLHADEVEALEAVAVRGYEVEARVDPGVVEAERCFAC